MALLTKGAIMTAFEEMLSEMTFDKITVSALVKRSGVSSNTFYYHYRDKFELLNEWFGTKLEIIRNGDDPTTWQIAIKKFFNMCRDNPRLIHHVFSAVSREQLEIYIFEIMDRVFLSNVRKKVAGKDIPDKRVRQISKFCTFAFIGFFMDYIWGDMEDDIDERVDSLSRIFDDFIASAISH